MSREEQMAELYDKAMSGFKQMRDALIEIDNLHRSSVNDICNRLSGDSGIRLYTCVRDYVMNDCDLHIPRDAAQTMFNGLRAMHDKMRTVYILPEK